MGNKETASFCLSSSPTSLPTLQRCIWSHTVPSLTALMLQGWSCTQHHIKASYAVTLMFHVCAEFPCSNSFVFIHIYETAQDLCFACLSCFSYSLKGNREKTVRSVTQHSYWGKRKTRHTEDWKLWGAPLITSLSSLTSPSFLSSVFPSSCKM